jgi:hypothetical protein
MNTMLRVMLDEIAANSGAFAHGALIGACLLARDEIRQLDQAMRELLTLFEECWRVEGGSPTAFDNLAEVQIARRLIGDPS